MIKFDLKYQDVWVTSDTHYAHKNICRGVTEWNREELNPGHSGTRDFDTLEQMNDTLVEGINKYVKEGDILIHLGDWSFGGIENIYKFRDRLVCKNIYLTYGNHDHHIKRNTTPENDSRSPQRLFTYADHVLDFTVKLDKVILDSEFSKGVEFFSSHYSHRVWDKHHKGRFHIYGHSHTSLEYLEHGRSMDVGIDNAFRLFGEYRPFNIREVFGILKNREILRIDHHDKNTN